MYQIYIYNEYSLLNIYVNLYNECVEHILKMIWTNIAKAGDCCCCTIPLASFLYDLIPETERLTGRSTNKLGFGQSAYVVGQLGI